MKRKRFQKEVCIFLVAMIIFSATGITFAADSLVTPKVAVEKAVAETGKYLHNTVKEPALGSMGGEWAILGLARANYPVESGYYEAYYNRVVEEMKEKKGELHKVKYTEYSRLILALTAIGKDVTHVGDYNLLEKLADYNSVIKQGINGPIFALIALDCHDYNIPKVKEVEVKTTRQMLIDYILSKEITSGDGVKGGFSLSGNVPDPDMTGMTLQALSNYQDQKKVKDVIERALNAISEYQMDNGGYGSWGSENSESTDQMIVALSALKIDAAKDGRFIKVDENGHRNWLISNLMNYCIPAASGQTGYGLEHILNTGINQMASEQGLYALVSYDRFMKGKSSLYDMTDVVIKKDANALPPPNANEIKVILNGETMRFDQPSVNMKGRVMVPLRAIFESLGAKVEWNQNDQKVTGVLGKKEITLTIGNSTAYVNHESKMLDVPGQIINNRTLVPIRFVAESLDAKVDWNQSIKTVIIDKKIN